MSWISKSLKHLSSSADASSASTNGFPGRPNHNGAPDAKRGWIGGTRMKKSQIKMKPKIKYEYEN